MLTSYLKAIVNILVVVRTVEGICFGFLVVDTTFFQLVELILFKNSLHLFIKHADSTIPDRFFLDC